MRVPSSLIDWWLLAASSTKHYCQVVMPWLRKFHVRLCRHGIWYNFYTIRLYQISCLQEETIQSYWSWTWGTDSKLNTYIINRRIWKW
jgi:hypothetical protein